MEMTWKGKDDTQMQMGMGMGMDLLNGEAKKVRYSVQKLDEPGSKANINHSAHMAGSLGNDNQHKRTNELACGRILCN